MIAYHEENQHDRVFHKAMEDPRYREVFLMLLERAYSPDKLVLALASHIKNVYLSKRQISTYMAGLIRDVRRADLILNPKIRALLRELDSECLELGTG